MVDDDLVQLVLGPLCHNVARDTSCRCLGAGGQGGVLVVDHWLIGDDPDLHTKEMILKGQDCKRCRPAWRSPVL